MTITHTHEPVELSDADLDLTAVNGGCGNDDTSPPSGEYKPGAGNLLAVDDGCTGTVGDLWSVAEKKTGSFKQR